MHREVVGGVLDQTTQNLLDEVLGYPGVPKQFLSPSPRPESLPLVPVTFEKERRTFNYFSTITTLGTPQDVLLQEVRVESFYPVDAETRTQAQRLASSTAPGPGSVDD